jgi:hypothetical protein
MNLDFYNDYWMDKTHGFGKTGSYGDKRKKKKSGSGEKTRVPALF